MDKLTRRARHGLRPVRILGLALLLLLIAAVSVGAAASEALGGKLRSGDTVTVPASETVPTDLYIYAGTARVDGKVEGDLVVAGGTIVLNGPVTGDVLVAGGNVTIDDATGGSIRAAGGTVTIGGTVARDVVVAGGQLSITPASHITGDAIFTGGQMTLDGAVDGNVLGNASAYTKGGTVKGTESVTVQQRQQRPTPQPWGPLAGVRGAIVRFVGIFLVGLLLLAILPRAVEGIATRLKTRTLLSLGFGALGLLGLIAAPVAILIVMLALAIPLGLLGFGLLSGFTVFAGIVALILGAFAVAVFVVFLADAWVGYALGQLLLQPIHAAWARGRIIALALGAAIIVTLTALPAVGGLVGLVVFLIALGALFLTARRDTRPITAATPAPQAGTGAMQAPAAPTA